MMNKIVRIALSRPLYCVSDTTDTSMTYDTGTMQYVATPPKLVNKVSSRPRSDSLESSANVAVVYCVPLFITSDFLPLDPWVLMAAVTTSSNDSTLAVLPDAVDVT